MATRSDSFAANLTEDQEWALFYKSRRCEWQIAAKWAVEEFGLERLPSRTAFYAWRKRMAAAEHEHNLGQALLAQQYAKDVAKDYKLTDEDAVKSLLSAATEATLLTHDAELAKSLVQMAVSLRATTLEKEKIALKSREADRKDEELKLALRKLEILEAKEKAASGALDDHKLSDQDKLLKIKEIFG